MAKGTINQCIMLGRLTSKKLDGRALRGVFETEYLNKEKTIKECNFVVYHGSQMALFDQIKPEQMVYIEGSVVKSPYNYQEIEIKHFEIPNK
jgi:aspartyl/asparaginyl-tRNA synthetase